MTIKQFWSQVERTFAFLYLIIFRSNQGEENPPKSEENPPNLTESSSGKTVTMNRDRINAYLERVIAELPDRRVPNEKFKFSDIYVPLIAKKADPSGNPETKLLEDWVKEWLDNDQKHDKVMFIQAPAGRGKSVFCRIFADSVRREPSWIPVLIELRHSRRVEVSFADFLRDAVKEALAEAVRKGIIEETDKDALDFTTPNENWLNDGETRFLFLLDGFDEYDKQDSRGLEQFLDKIEIFQQDCHNIRQMGHRILLTGRQQSLQNLKQLSDKFELVEIMPMNMFLEMGKPPLWEEWLDRKWKPLVGEGKVSEFKEFLKDPRWQDSVQELIKEPLLLYFLAAQHKSGDLKHNPSEDPTGVKVKIWIYTKSLDWVLTQQRPASFQQKITGLKESEELLPNLLPILAEAGMCVVQSDGKSASMEMLKERLNNPDDDALKNALATFYIEPQE